MKKQIIGLAAGALLVSAGSVSAADKMFNVSTNPFALLFTNYNVEVDYKVHDKITVAPTFNMWALDLGAVSFSTMGFGARVNYQVNGAYNTGPYVSGVFNYTTLTMETTSLILGEATGESSAMVFGAKGGYQWFWDTTNIKLGAGYGMGSIGDTTMTYSDGTTTTYDGGTPGAGFLFDLTVGYSF